MVTKNRAKPEGKLDLHSSSGHKNYSKSNVHSPQMEKKSFFSGLTKTKQAYTIHVSFRLMMIYIYIVQNIMASCIIKKHLQLKQSNKDTYMYCIISF